ncbi:MAG TPA: hypothetical protein VNH11_18915 [Pirellulales bacterium]|nr:hypothetical protein [Pirellulales bacterium]
MENLKIVLLIGKMATSEVLAPKVRNSKAQGGAQRNSGFSDERSVLALKGRHSAGAAAGIARRMLCVVCVPFLVTAFPAVAVERHAANVPPALEIEVLDPNADPRGNPAVELVRGRNGQLAVDIPRTILVHKFYYSGDRSFQAQMLPGGPTIAVVDHPKTGQRCYIDLNMLPGAPRVTYTAHEIQYDYGHQAIILCFKGRRPKVIYRNGTPITTKAIRSAKAVAACTTTVLEESGVCHYAAEAAHGTKNAVVNVVHGAHDVVVMAATPVLNVARMTPIGSLFKAAPERKRDAEVARAEHAQQAGNDTIRTLR